MGKAETSWFLTSKVRYFKLHVFKINVHIFYWLGGTFDVSVLTTEKCNIVVKAVGGDWEVKIFTQIWWTSVLKNSARTGLPISKNAENSKGTNEKKMKTFEIFDDYDKSVRQTSKK